MYFIFVTGDAAAEFMNVFVHIPVVFADHIERDHILEGIDIFFEGWGHRPNDCVFVYGSIYEVAQAMTQFDPNFFPEIKVAVLLVGTPAFISGSTLKYQYLLVCHQHTSFQDFNTEAKRLMLQVFENDGFFLEVKQCLSAGTMEIKDFINKFRTINPQMHEYLTRDANELEIWLDVLGNMGVEIKHIQGQVFLIAQPPPPPVASTNITPFFT
jgi:hypothetical protein